MDEMRQVYQQLKEMARDGRLRRFCDEHGVDLLVGFGSAIRDTGRPAGDVDLAFRFADPKSGNILDLINALMDLLKINDIDLMDLSRADSVPAEQALAYGEVLVERNPGDFAEAQIAAITSRMDTAWLRRIELEQLAQWR